MYLDIESIEHADGKGDARHAQRLRQAHDAGYEFRIEAGKRAEFSIGPGDRAIVYVLEGSVRFEGDDTPAVEGDTVWFKPAAREAALVGVQADRPARGILVAGPLKDERPGL
jgi:redox-sensitive bicupin YhaK (pirin superfamily)